MAIEIIDIQSHNRGKIYTIRIQPKTVRILFLAHAIERIKKWNIKEEIVAESLLLPEEVIIGHRIRYIAHRRYGGHLVRAVYEYEGELPVLLTVYFPYANRTFKEAVFMKIKYSKEADILLIELKDGTPADSIDSKEGVILHLDKEGSLLEIEILDASKVAMLNEISVMTPMEATR